MKKIESLTTSSMVDLYENRNASQAATYAWHAMGDQGFGVREVRGSNPTRTPPFKGVTFKGEKARKVEVS